MNDNITKATLTRATDSSLVGQELPEQPRWVGQKRRFNKYRKYEKRGQWRKTEWPDEIAQQPRTCTKCKVTKTVANFGPLKTSKDGIQHRCRECVAAYAASRRNPDVARAWSLKRLYGITVEQYEAQSLAQGGQCAVCGLHESEIIENGRMGARRLSVDHDHETNTLRGLVCQGCNTALGLLKNSPALMIRAARYLQDHADRVGTLGVAV